MTTFLESGPSDLFTIEKKKIVQTFDKFNSLKFQRKNHKYFLDDKSKSECI
jgi:hypothetical protein